jgi:hypothetical protein
MDQPTAAPTLAIVWNRDLLFGTRIRNALVAIGLQPQFVKSAEQFMAALTARYDEVAIVIIDMNDAIPWDDVRATLVACPHAPPIIGFGPHTDAAGRRAAKSAGLTRVISNGQFHKDMTELIDRYLRR